MPLTKLFEFLLQPYIMSFHLSENHKLALCVLCRQEFTLSQTDLRIRVFT